MDRRLAEPARLIADDAYAAVMFQTLGQYRTALLAALRSQAAQRSGPTREQVDCNHPDPELQWVCERCGDRWAPDPDPMVRIGVLEMEVEEQRGLIETQRRLLSSEGERTSGPLATEMDVPTVDHRDPIFRQLMVVCGTCGNKRCPGVNGHPCTGSNAPGQPGSNFE